MSVMLTMVLLKVANMWAIPLVMFLLPLALMILIGSIVSSKERLTGAGEGSSLAALAVLDLADLVAFALVGAASADAAADWGAGDGVSVGGAGLSDGEGAAELASAAGAAGVVDSPVGAAASFFAALDAAAFVFGLFALGALAGLSVGAASG